MLTKKICMIGDFGVGKTSLVSRYVHSQFSDQYLTTIGVKIDSKTLLLPSGDEIKIILWDMAGNPSLSTIEHHYLQGASGYFLVSDSTRADTLETTISLQKETESIIGEKPFTLMLNKIDLDSEYRLSTDVLANLEARNWSIIQSSAKQGIGVEEAFSKLGQRMFGA